MFIDDSRYSSFVPAVMDRLWKEVQYLDWDFLLAKPIESLLNLCEGVRVNLRPLCLNRSRKVPVTPQHPLQPDA